MSTSSGEAAITAENVWKTFRVFTDRSTTLKQAIVKKGKGNKFEEFWALKDVSFEVPKGTTFGIIGGNGAGKSTMLKVLSRILVPDKGTVVTRGKMSSLLELGAGFHPELTGRENVFLNGSILGMSKATLKARFDDILAFSGMEKFIDNPVKTYSSGMYARLGFSVAVHVDPEILLVDEVLAVGDEQFQRRCHEKMAEIRADGRTVVFVSHGLGHVQNLCDEAMWLDHGQVQAIGGVSDVVDQYLASVESQYRVDGTGRKRSGSGEAEVVARLEHGGSGHSLVTGQPVDVRFKWVAHEPIDDALFSCFITSVEGHTISGAVSTFQLPVQRLEGEGELVYRIPALPLLPGTYHLAAALGARHSGHVYDSSPDMAVFDVVPGAHHRGDWGHVTLNGTWHVEPKGDAS